VSLTDDLLATHADAFARDGFVVVPDVFSPEELARFGAAVDAAVARDRADDRRSLAEKSRYEQSFIQSMHIWARMPEVLPWSCHPRLAELAARLLGVEAIRMWHDQALYKEPGGRRTDPHQDQPYWPMREPSTITAWVPFQDVDRHNGGMAFYPGSHRIGLKRFVDIFGDEEPEDIGRDELLAGIDPVHVEVPAGAVSFHHGLTAHFAEPNRSPELRRVHTVIYCADGVHRSSDRPHPSVDLDRIPPGAPIDGSLTPVLWPRPDGSLPPHPEEAARAMTEYLERRRRRRRQRQGRSGDATG
jgi:ectoine hydroxylase-related dioxygenase (phytanoyl-CoA dioxygenase family)